MSSTFASFHLTIAAPHGDRYPVTARTQAGHEVSEDILLPLDDETLTVYQMALRYPISIDESVVIAVGQLLYRTLFQGTIAEAFATARTHADQQKVALRLHLAIQKSLPTVAALPWELMATEAGRPLMLEHALVRTFSWNDPIPDLGIPPGERIRLAVTSALPTELADHPIAAEDEVAIIRAVITHSTRPIDLIEVPHLTRDRLTDLLTNQRPHIVHHIGHGIIQSDMSYLDLERADQSRDQLSAREFSSMLHQSGVQLVVLNACHTGSAGENLLTSFAPIFITDRIPAAIGMQAAILNRTGHCFANAFYAALGNSGSIDASLITARKAILADGHEHGAWGFPTLYSRVPHSQLWGDRTPQPVDPLTQRDRERITKAAQQIESDRLLTLRLEGFVGRVNELAAIREHIATMRPTGGYVLIKAAAGEGKSSSIAKLIQEAGITQTPHHFIALTTGREYQLGLLRAVVAQLILKHGLTVSYFPEDSYPAMKAEFARILDELSKQGIHETIYLDGLDQLQPEIDGSRDLSFLPPQPPPCIVIVLGSRPDETLKPLEILHRVDYELPPLSEPDALALWRSVQPAVADSLLHDLYAALKGNALFVHFAADTMRDQSIDDATSLIRQIEQNPSNLFGITLERIKNRSEHRWPTIWKPMLALLLVAQEPLRLDVLGDLLAHDHDTMQDAVLVLGGLVSQGIDQRVALHHLLFRDYLAASVFNAREIKRWQQRLADWCAIDLDSIWTDDRDAVEQARRMYARHHYITHLSLAENWPMLWHVLDAGDYGEQKTRFDPSTRLYALDLDRGRESAIKAGKSDEEHIQNLPRMWKYSLLRTSLTSRVDELPDNLFVALAMLGRIQEALERIELISDPIRQIEIWGDISQWCNENQRMVLINRIQKINNGASSFPEYHQTKYILALVKMLITMGNLRQVKNILDDGIEDNSTRAHAFLTLARIAIDLKNIDHASILINQAMILVSTIEDHYKRANLVADIAYGMSSIGNTTHALDAINEAITIAHSIPLEELRAQMFAQIAYVAAYTKDTNNASNLINQALDITYSIQVAEIRAKLLAEIAYAASINSNNNTSALINQALAATLSIDDNNVRDHTLLLIYSINAAIDNIDQSLNNIPNITLSKTRIKATVNIAMAYINSKDFNKATILINESISAIHTILPSEARAQSLEAIAVATGNGGYIEQAITLAQSINKGGSSARAHALIAYSSNLNGNRDRAVTLVAEAHKIACLMNNDREQAWVLAVIADAAISINGFNESKNLINDAIIAAQSVSLDTIRADILAFIANTIYASNDLDKAIFTADSISLDRIRATTFAVLATVAENQGDKSKTTSLINKALNIIRDVDNEDKVVILATIANTATAIGNLSYAVDLINQAIKIARSIPFDGTRARVLEVIAHAAATSGDYNHAICIAKSIDDRRIHEHTLAKIAFIAANAGDITYTTSIIDQITNFTHNNDNNYHAHTLMWAANAATVIGAFDQAGSIAQSIDHQEFRFTAFKRLFKANPSTQLSIPIIQTEWKNNKTEHTTWQSLPLVISLIKGYPWLGTAILEEEIWVNNQLKRLG